MYLSIQMRYTWQRVEHVQGQVLFRSFRKVLCMSASRLVGTNTYNNRPTSVSLQTVDFTIVTPVYNDPRVKRTLKSILNQQNAPSTEIIIVDGGSMDRTTDILQDHRHEIDILIQEPDRGVYDAMNKGIQQASGEVIGILNSDDYYSDNYVLRDVASRLKETGADTCYGDLVYIDEDGSPLRYWESGKYHSKRFYFGWMPPHPTFFVKKKTYEEWGGFDLDFTIAADYELMLRFLLKYGVATAYIDRVVVRMAIGGQSNKSITNIIKANWEVRQSWKKNELRGGALVPILKPLRKMSQFQR